MEPMKKCGVDIGLTIDKYYTCNDESFVEKDYVPARSKRGNMMHFSIFGGHGGDEAMNFAREHLFNIIAGKESFLEDDDEKVVESIKDGFRTCHALMMKMSAKEEWNRLSGSTATMVFLRGKKMFVANVGDGKVMLIDDALAVRVITEDHAASKEVDRIQMAGGEVSAQGRLLVKVTPAGHRGPILRNTVVKKLPYLHVARSLGDFWSYDPVTSKSAVVAEPDVKVIQLCSSRERFIVVANGAAFKSIDVASVGRIVYNERNPAKHLAEACGSDKVAIVVITLDKPWMKRLCTLS